METWLDTFLKHIKKALNKTCPEKPTKIRDKNNPWWTKELQADRRNLNKLYKHRTENEEQYKKYKEEQKIYRKKCLKAKAKNWEQFVEQQDSLDSINKLRKILEKNSSISIGILQKPDKTFTNPGKETLDFLLESHFPSLTEIKETTYTDIAITATDLKNPKVNFINTIASEVVFDSFKSKKSPGPDGLKPIVFKHLPHNCLKTLCSIYKACVLLEFTPTVWKGSKVIWIPKSGKTDYKIAKAWRPISLSNYMIKALEKLITFEVDRCLKDNPIHKNQHGFQRAKSTESAMSQVQDRLEQRIDKNKPALGFFLDIQAAFDTIQPKAIQNALLLHGVHKTIANWYTNYITHRNLYTEHNGDVSSASIAIGFPQGGVCSAKFWIIAFNKAIEISNQYGALGVGFADDLCILVEQKNVKNAIGIGQRIIDELIEWGGSIGLTFNPSKTVVIPFGLKLNDKELQRHKLRINGQTVEYSEHTRYLGVEIDSKLKWTHHINQKICKAKQSLIQVLGILQKR